MFESLQFWKSENTAVTPRSVAQRAQELKTIALELTTAPSAQVNTATNDGKVKALKQCAVLQSVISKRMEYTANATFMLVNSQGDDVTASNGKVLAQVLAPNSFDTLTELLVKIRYNIDVFGVAYVLRVGTTALDTSYIVPHTQDVEEITQLRGETSFNPKDLVSRYQVTFGTSLMQFGPEDVQPIYDTINLEFGKPFSRLEGLGDVINASINSYNVQNQLLANRGMLGIISLSAKGADSTTDAIISESERNSVKQAISKYGATKGRQQNAVTNLEANYTKVSAELKDLGTIDILETNTRAIADAYGIPSILLDMASSKYDNLEGAKLNVYTSVIAPSANKILAELSIFMGLSVKIAADYSHLDIYQQANARKWTAANEQLTTLMQAEDRGYITNVQAKDKAIEILQL